jgi:DNA (cytosine-5)-methyltransferase 1
MVVDNFAGGGGASTGIESALGRPVDIAINHSREAIAMHRANHPETRHYCENVWEVDPRQACGSRPVGLAWFSPDCTHFSRAKGGKPVSRDIRGLAWVVLRWAGTVRPRVIVLENVQEFQTWGPLDDSGRPDKGKAGETFDAWCRQLCALGYTIEFRMLTAADYGTPTLRRRLFLVARRDGSPVAWPEETHGHGRPAPWTPALSVIDWSHPAPSIFDRARPLAEATLRRIALGVRRYVLDAADPFIIPLTHHGAPRAYGVREPLRTVKAAHRGEFALVAPTLVQTGYGERKGQTPRALDLAQPLGTVVAGGAKHGLVAAFLSKHYGGVVGHGLRRPLGTVTTKDHHALTTARLEAVDRTSHVTAFLAKYAEPPPAQLVLGATLRDGVVVAGGQRYTITDIGMRMLQPRELFSAQGFPHEYEIAPEVDGRPLTKTSQIALAGNSVCPQVAMAVVAANSEQRERRLRKAGRG